MSEPDKRTVSDDVRKQAREIVDYRFRHTDHSEPLTRILYEEALDRLLKKAAADPSLLTTAPVLDTEYVDEGSEVKRPLGPVEFIAKEIRLPSMPQVAIELQRVMNDPGSDASDLAEVISLDQKLTAALLRLVNSALFSFPSKIDTVSRAVALVGTRQISTLALGAMMIDLFKDCPSPVLPLEQFWKHSLACAHMSGGLAQNCSRLDVERYFVAGLLHDMGRLALTCSMPGLVMACIRRAEERECLLFEAENEILGFTHARLGAMMLKKWELPDSLVAGLIYHHDPTRSAKHDEPAIVHLADAVVHALSIGSSGERFVPRIEVKAIEPLGLTPELVMSVVHDLDELLEATFDSLLG